MPKIAFFDLALKSISSPERGQVDYWDEKLPAFGLRVSRGGSKTFVLKRHNSRITIGRYGVVTLAVDLGGAQFDSSIKYELATAEGKTVAAGEAPPPATGAALLLMLSGSAVKSADHYVLTLKGERPPLTLTPYRFRVKAP